MLSSFGRQVKLFRERAGTTQAEPRERIGYLKETAASVEQGRRVAQPQFVDAADELLGAGGVLSVVKPDLELARYPVHFQGFALLEADARSRFS